MAREPFSTTLTEIQELSPTVRHFRFTLDSGGPFVFKAGQFVMLHAPIDPEKPIRRPYSIASPPTETSNVDLMVKLVDGGPVTNWMWELKEQDKANLDGPYGAFVLPKELPRELILISTGTGLAPFRSMTLMLLEQKADVKITMLFGVRYEDEIPYSEEFDALAKQHPNFQFIPTISRPRNQPKPWTGEVGYVQTKLEQYAPAKPDKLIYICGLSPMIKAVEETALKLGFDKKQIHYEKYD